MTYDKVMSSNKLRAYMRGTYMRGWGDGASRQDFNSAFMTQKNKVLEDSYVRGYTDGQAAFREALKRIHDETG